MTMNLPELSSRTEEAVDELVYVFNETIHRLGAHEDLFELANRRSEISSKIFVPLADLVHPLQKSCEKFLTKTIEHIWRLTPTFMYYKRSLGRNETHGHMHYYYEAVFSQPTPLYPIPQAQVSVFFRIENKLTEPQDINTTPMVFFRIEGQHTEHDIRYVAVTIDWLLAVIKMKINLFKRIESYNKF